MTEETGSELLTLTSDIVSAHVSNNSVHAGDVPTLITSVYAALSGLDAPVAEPQAQKPQGAVTARKSLANPEHILSMIDGKPYKSLRRHIGKHGHTPESYRETYGLPRDYPMTAVSYSDTRRALAHKIGLGRKPKAETPPDGAAKPEAPATRSRKPKALGEALSAAKGHLGSS